MDKAVKLGIYRHFKGHLYEVLFEGTHTETGETLVIYKALYTDAKVRYGQVFARPKEHFMGQAECPDGPYKGTKTQRFLFIKPSKGR